MKILAISVGLPKEVEWQGKKVSTGIFNEVVSGPLWVRTLNLEGDGQADLTVHGGEHKAVYTYAAEYYEWWRRTLTPREVAFGEFGENFTTQGLDEARVNVGDIFQFGSSVLEAAQPRQPCFKLGIKFDDMSIVKTFLDSGRFGIYFRVVKEGQVKTGDAIQKLSAHPAQIAVYDVQKILKGPLDLEKIKRLLTVETLEPGIRQRLEKRLISPAG